MERVKIPDNRSKTIPPKQGNFFQKKYTSPFFFQPKLTINQPNDPYEQEADAMADKVMGMTGHENLSHPFFRPRASSLQRKCGHCKEEEKRMQRQEVDGKETSTNHSLESYVDHLNSGGKPLSKDAIDFFEPRMGYDFSNVRIHTDRAANESAREANAHAYTYGNDIVFAFNQFKPHTENGRKLLAHELTHVVQQNNKLNTKRIQRLDDNSFEASSGVDQGIATGTMTADSIAGQTFTVNCGFQNYTIRFRFPKAYKGVYPYRAASRDVKGVYVKMQASIDDNRYSGRCTPLRLLQTVRKIKRNASGNIESADWNNAIRNQRAGWNDSSAPSRGWMVDRVTTATVPFYTSGPNALEGSETSPATLYDTPGFWSSDSNVGMEFYTSVVCENAANRRWVAASVSWGFYTDSSGNISFRPANPVATCGNPTEVQDASGRWDAIPGNTSTGITF